MDPQEATSDDGGSELEALLGSLSNGELAELLTEMKKTNLKGIKDKTSGQRREIPFDNDIEGIVQQNQAEEAACKSFDQEIYNDGVEGKRLSGQPRWHQPSTESTQEVSSFNTAAEERKSTILIEGHTQTDSLSLVQEHKDVFTQTDPVQLTSEETLEKGIADFRRDRAERQLRKSRLSQDVVAFKNRHKESTPGSFHETETLGPYSKGAPRNSISSCFSPSQWSNSPFSVREASSYGTADVYSRRTEWCSMSSGYLSQDSIEGEALDLKDVPSKKTPRKPTTSSPLPEPRPFYGPNQGTEDMLRIESHGREPTASSSSPHPRPFYSQSRGTEDLLRIESHGQEPTVSSSLPHPRPFYSQSRGTEDLLRIESHGQEPTVSSSLPEPRPFFSQSQGTEDGLWIESRGREPTASSFLPQPRPFYSQGQGTEDGLWIESHGREPTASSSLPEPRPFYSQSRGTENVLRTGTPRDSVGAGTTSNHAQPTLVKGKPIVSREKHLEKDKEARNRKDDVWISQGAKPKRRGLLYNDSCIVSGVDSSFPARHSRDSSLTQRLPDQYQYDQPATSDESRLPYQGLPLETRTDSERSTGTEICSHEEQKKKRYFDKKNAFDARNSKKAMGKENTKHGLLSKTEGISHGEDDQTREQPQIAFDNSHKSRSPATFGSPPLINGEYSSGVINGLSPPQCTNANSLSSDDDESYKTADSSLESFWGSSPNSGHDLSHICLESQDVARLTAENVRVGRETASVVANVQEEQECAGARGGIGREEQQERPRAPDDLRDGNISIEDCRRNIQDCIPVTLDSLPSEGEEDVPDERMNNNAPVEDAESDDIPGDLDRA